MEQIRKALSRSKTAFESIQHRTDLIEDEVIPGREIYEIEKGLKEIASIKNLISVQEKYIKLLADELEEVVPIAGNHGWKSTRFKSGQECRKEISEIKTLIKSEGQHEDT